MPNQVPNQVPNRICDIDKHIWGMYDAVRKLQICTLCGAGHNGMGYVAPFATGGLEELILVEDDTPPLGVPAILRVEAPCPTCKTSLFDDEPSCWRCGWRRP